MLRGWKSASCKGFPAPSCATDGDVIEARGNLLATKNIPMLSNQLLRPMPLMNPPVSFDFAAMHCLLSFYFFYIVYFRLSKWDKSQNLETRGNGPGARRFLSRSNRPGD
jgi:hypothetical protein